MRGGITAVAALVLLGALWFLAGDDDGRNAVPRLFDNMNDRPLADAAAPDRKTRLAPPRSVAQSLGMNGTVRKREDDRDSFAAEGSYFSSGRMQGGEEDSGAQRLAGEHDDRSPVAVFVYDHMLINSQIKDPLRR